MTLPILRRHVMGFVAVGEEEILQAMQFAYERLTIVIEPSSAVALVPLLRQEPQLVSKRVGVVLTGGQCGVVAALATSGRGQDYAAIGWLTSHACEGL